jgi:hypothetical protein
MASQLIIEVSGGVVTEVYSSDPDTEVILIDWDTDGSSEDEEIVAVHDDQGREELARSVKIPTAPLSQLPRQTKSAAQRAV